MVFKGSPDGNALNQYSSAGSYLGQWTRVCVKLDGVWTDGSSLITIAGLVGTWSNGRPSFSIAQQAGDCNSFSFAFPADTAAGGHAAAVRFVLHCFDWLF